MSRKRARMEHDAVSGVAPADAPPRTQLPCAPLIGFVCRQPRPCTVCCANLELVAAKLSILVRPASDCAALCRRGAALGEMLGVRGSLPVVALDGSCGTAELPARDTVLQRTAPANAAGAQDVQPVQELGRVPADAVWWAPGPLRQMLRSCAAVSPLTGALWQRLPQRRLSCEEAALHAQRASADANLGSKAARVQAAAVNVQEQ